MFLIKKVVVRLRNHFLKRLNRRKFLREVKSELLLPFNELLVFSFDQGLCSADYELGRHIEGLRSALATNSLLEKINTFGSPHGNDELYDGEGNVKPGQFKASSVAGVARTGTNVFGGIQLKKIVDSFGSGAILELGTNTGLSGCYFLSSKNTTKLYTIEGSSDLCPIATENLKSISNDFVVINKLFDQAIRDLADDMQPFRYAFIDGQHEKKATLLYKEMILPIMEPGGVLILDDIYWSEGMHEAWLDVIGDPRFDLTIDLGWRGICRLRGDQTDSSRDCHHVDLTTYTGKPNIQRPGW